MVDDEEESTKVTEKSEAMADSNGAEVRESGEAEKPQESIDASPKAPELSAEVRAKLRKLEKLESRYQGRHFARCGSYLLIVQFRTLEVLPYSTFPSSFHRTIRKGAEGEYSAGWHI